MDDTYYYIMIFNNIYGQVCLSEIFVIVGSVILRFHCMQKIACKNVEALPLGCSE